MEQSINEIELRKEYEEKKKAITEIRMQLRTLHQEKEGYFSQLHQLHNQISSQVSSIKELKGERNQLTTEVQKLKEERQKLNKNVHEKALQKKNVDEKKRELSEHESESPQFVKMTIHRLEKKIETEVMPFTKEQQLRKTIKELKVKYKKLEENQELMKEVNTISADFTEQRRKAYETHQAVQEKAHDSQEKHQKLTVLYEEVKKLREQEKPLREKVAEHKKKMEEMKKNADELQKRITELMSLLNEHQEKNFKQIAKEKTAEVQEKIKKGKKLSTEDILAFQALKE